MSKLTAQEIQEIHFRLNGSHAGPWSPDYTFAKECGGGRFWGNRMLQCIAALEAELAACEKGGHLACEYLAKERDEARALAAKYKEALEWYASIDYVTHEWGRCSVGDRARQSPSRRGKT
jgi:hypothetical protein